MWNERYSEPGFAYGTEPNDFLVERADALPSRGRALSLAEGEGRNAVWLAARGLDVLAVDQSEVGLQKANELARSRGVAIETRVADLATFEPPAASFDVILSIWAHVPHDVRVALHRRCVAALRPGGVLLLEAYTPAQIAHGTGGPKDPSMCMTLAALRDELAGLTFDVGVERERSVTEGRFHGGMSSVVQVVARRL